MVFLAQRPNFAAAPSLDQVSIEWIGPEDAAQYLATNLANRNPRTRKMTSYARDMRAGNWQFNGDSIKFDLDRELIDGQNRLMAIVLSGVTVPLLVVRGLARKSQETMDIGAARSFGDALKMRGHSCWNEKASATALLFRWNLNAAASTATIPSIAELMATFEANPWIDSDATLWMRIARQTPLTPSQAAVTWGELSRIDATDAADFFARLGSDSGHQEGDPVLALRRALAIGSGSGGVRGSRIHVRATLALTFKAWNKYRNGEKVTLLSYRAGGARPEEFPMPH